MDTPVGVWKSVEARASGGDGRELPAPRSMFLWEVSWESPFFEGPCGDQH